MAGKVYTVVFEGVAVTATQDFFEISPADDRPCEVIGLFLSQYSDVGDAASEILSYSVIRGFTASGSGGSAATPRPLDPSDTVAFSAEVNNTTVANTGTGVVLHRGSFNIAVGEALWLPPGAEWKVTQANTTLVVRLNSAPADSLTMNGTLYVREL